MQKALQCTNLFPPAIPSPGEIGSVTASLDMKKMVTENAVVVVAREGCCMCHVVKLLLNGHGVSPTILDVDDQNEGDIKNELSTIGGGGTPPQLPAVFVGGELFGGLEQVIGAHISGELVPRLREARALWL